MCHNTQDIVALRFETILNLSIRYNARIGLVRNKPLYLSFTTMTSEFSEEHSPEKPLQRLT